MDKIGKKRYFNILMSYIVVLMNIVAFLGRIIFFILGIINDMNIKDLLAYGFGVFGFFIFLFECLLLFECFTYWRIDEDGIANGGLFWEKKIYFASADYYCKGIGLVPSLINSRHQAEKCFKLVKGKKMCLFLYIVLQKKT